ncbi:MAG: hypothetical protein JSR96_10640 [Proteobacteria bacterium]|nr:hypothetical protein [Pseudomonadota bacterium]
MAFDKTAKLKVAAGVAAFSAVALSAPAADAHLVTFGWKQTTAGTVL